MADIIEDIIAAARRKPLRIVQRFRLRGTDGRWYGSGGVPIGVALTGERRAFYVTQADDGTTHGRAEATAEAVAAREAEYRAERDAELRTDLQAMDASALAAQAEYWLGVATN